MENTTNLDLDMAGLSPVVERPLPFKQGNRRLFIVRHGERVSHSINCVVGYSIP